MIPTPVSEFQFIGLCSVCQCNNLMSQANTKHGLVCLLHEKPFAGVNGSGKHNNWSLSTDTGINLLEPGKSPHENAQFLLFFEAVIKAIDEYQDLMRVSVASAGNDHRLGANEAPPAIMSMFIGDDLEEILEALVNKVPYNGSGDQTMEIGVHVLPNFPKDTTDRNRTSPFAFTGNKFEFRSLGSAASISGANIVLNTIVAEELKQFADELEQAADFTETLNKLIRRTIREHKHIIFNGDGYSAEWPIEAQKRGLLNLRTTIDALPEFIAEKNVKLFTQFGIFTETELHSRYEILLETYSKIINIEGLTMVDMANKDILPAVNTYIAKLTSTAAAKKGLNASLPCKMELSLIEKLSTLEDKAYEQVGALTEALANASGSGLALASYYKDVVITAMNELRATVDAIEVDTDASLWPYPQYGDLLFKV